MLSVSALDVSGCDTPLLLASASRPMSTVSSTSAGLFCPSAAIRSVRPAFAKMTFVLMPVLAVNALRSGSISTGSRYEYMFTTDPDWLSAGTAVKNAASPSATAPAAPSMMERPPVEPLKMLRSAMPASPELLKFQIGEWARRRNENDRKKLAPSNANTVDGQIVPK